MNLSQKRAETLALLALIMHLLFFLFALWIGAAAQAASVRVGAWYILGGAGIWLILLIQFHQRRLAQEERFDREQYQRLKRQGEDKSVFETITAEGAMDLAQRRLVWLEKYLLAVFSVITAGYLLAMGYWMLHSLRMAEQSVLGNHEILLASAAYLAGMALVSFLFSRYAIGMSDQGEWRPLRAGGSYMLSNSLACFGLAIIIVLADGGYVVAEKVAAHVLAVLMMAIGAEIVLNLILDAYRPRIAGEYRCAAYESRLLGLFSEPGGILRTAAHAIDYQFGFKVSETWFYKLLERAVLPLMVLNVVILYLMSCFAVVPTGRVAVKEHFGRPVNRETPYQSGLHLKWPWPIDKMRSFPVDEVQMIDVGFKRYDDERQNIPLLWTLEHWEEEFEFMVARVMAGGEVEGTEGDDADAEVQSAGNDFDTLVVALTVHYRIDDVAQYAYGSDHCYREPRVLLEEICDRAVVHFAANRDIDTLLGPGRHVTTDTIGQAIQDQVDRLGMGIRIVFVGMETVHPPMDVADDFEKVVAALQDRQALVLEARGKASKALAAAQGAYDVLLAQAEAYRFSREILSQARAERFKQQLYAYEKGGQAYLWREYLAALDEVMGERRKFLLIGDNIDRLVYEVDLKEKLQPDLFEGLDIEETTR